MGLPSHRVECQTPRVFLPLLADTTPDGDPVEYLGAHGGRGSGKSHFFGENMVEQCLARPVRAVCIREVQKSIAQSIKLLIEDKITKFGVRSYFDIKDTYIRTPHDGIIVFHGMQNHTADTIKSLEGFNIALVEEAQRLSKRSWGLLRPTIRRPGAQVWAAWNPDKATDAVDNFYRNKNKPKGCITVEANYLDNPFLPDKLANDAKYDAQYNKDDFAHVWLGAYASQSSARVFKRWRIATDDDRAAMRVHAKTVHLFGSDFGFGADAAILVRCHFEEKPIPGKPVKLYVTAEAFQHGVEIDALSTMYDHLDPERPKMARKYVITADSSRPDLISYLRRNGYPLARPAKKGAGSVEAGVKFLQSYEIVVDPSCVNTIRELTRYSYKVDKHSETVLPVLQDEENHVIDSLRYAVESSRTNRIGLW